VLQHLKDTMYSVTMFDFEYKPSLNLTLMFDFISSIHTRTSSIMSNAPSFTFYHAPTQVLTFDRKQFFAAGVALDAGTLHDNGMTGFQVIAYHVFFGMLHQLQAHYTNPFDFIDGHIPSHLQNAPFISYVLNPNWYAPAPPDDYESEIELVRFL